MIRTGAPHFLLTPRLVWRTLLRSRGRRRLRCRWRRRRPHGCCCGSGRRRSCCRFWRRRRWHRSLGLLFRGCGLRRRRRCRPGRIGLWPGQRRCRRLRCGGLSRRRRGKPFLPEIGFSCFRRGRQPGTWRCPRSPRCARRRRSALGAGNGQRIGPGQFLTQCRIRRDIRRRNAGRSRPGRGTDRRTRRRL